MRHITKEFLSLFKAALIKQQTTGNRCVAIEHLPGYQVKEDDNLQI